MALHVAKAAASSWEGIPIAYAPTLCTFDPGAWGDQIPVWRQGGGLSRDLHAAIGWE